MNITLPVWKVLSKRIRVFNKRSFKIWNVKECSRKWMKDSLYITLRALQQVHVLSFLFCVVYKINQLKAFEWHMGQVGADQVRVNEECVTGRAEGAIPCALLNRVDGDFNIICTAFEVLITNISHVELFFPINQSSYHLHKTLFFSKYLGISRHHWSHSFSSSYPGIRIHLKGVEKSTRRDNEIINICIIFNSRRVALFHWGKYYVVKSNTSWNKFLIYLFCLVLLTTDRTCCSCTGAWAWSRPQSQLLEGWWWHGTRWNWTGLLLQ